MGVHIAKRTVIRSDLMLWQFLQLCEGSNYGWGLCILLILLVRHTDCSDGREGWL